MSDTATTQISDKDIWDKVKARLEVQLGEKIFEAFFRRVILEEGRDPKGQVRLSVPTQFLVSWITNSYLVLMQILWREEQGHEVRIQMEHRAAGQAVRILDPEDLIRRQPEKISPFPHNQKLGVNKGGRPAGQPTASAEPTETKAVTKSPAPRTTREERKARKVDVEAIDQSQLDQWAEELLVVEGGKITVRACLLLMARVYNVSVEGVVGWSLMQAYLSPRHEGILLANFLTDASYRDIGRQFGERTEVEVNKVLEKQKKRYRTNTTFKDRIAKYVKAFRRQEAVLSEKLLG